MTRIIEGPRRIKGFSSATRQREANPQRDKQDYLHHADWCEGMASRQHLPEDMRKGYELEAEFFKQLANSI